MKIRFTGILPSALIWMTILTIDAYAQGSFLYTFNGGNSENSVSGFSVDGNGALTSIPGSPFPTGAPSVGFGNDIIVSPVGNHLFVSNDRDPKGSSVSAFSISPTTGNLTPVPGSPFTTGTGILGGLSLDLTPDGQFLFAANTSTGKIAVFSLGSNGLLAPVPGSPFTGSNIGVGPIRVSPDGRFLFVTSRINDSISAFSIASNGSLTPVPGSPFSVDGEGDVVSIEINCAGTLLFAADMAGNVAVFNIAGDGSLTPVPGTPFFINSPGDQQILINQTGDLLFVSNTSAARVSAFSVGSDGSISPLPVSDVFIGDPNNEDRRPIDLGINREETLLYVMSADSTILVFSINTSGIVGQVPGSPFINTGGSGYGAMLAAFPPRACTTGATFDLCIQDESNGNILRINSNTGEYEFSSCNGFAIGGTGMITVRGTLITLQHIASDRRVIARIDSGLNRATASIQIFSQGATMTITDRNITNNTCVCRQQ